MKFKYLTYLSFLTTLSLLINGCSSTKVDQSKSNSSVNALKKNTNTISAQSSTLNSPNKKERDNNIKFVRDRNSSFSNNIRVKTIYELAQEHNPNLFLPHDEFETAKEYEDRISRQVLLMKDIVLLSSKKMDIKKAEKIQLSRQREQERKAKIESLLAESMTTVDLKADAIGRYNIEDETFPIVVNGVSYQVVVPIKEARDFKNEFENVKIEGLKQLKAINNIKINVKKAHIRTRPNGSILGIASRGHQFDHLKFEDEWHKIIYKGQVAYTHQNNASVHLVGVSDEYEYMDLVVVHPKTGSVFSLNSMKDLVSAPLDLASRKLLESGKADGPN